VPEATAGRPLCFILDAPGPRRLSTGVRELEMKTLLQSFGFVGCAVVLYIFGIGPALRVTQGHDGLRNAAEVLYSPLLRVGRHSDLLDSYLEFWEVRWKIRDRLPLPGKK
jgi:hypothetical protein